MGLKRCRLQWVKGGPPGSKHCNGCATTMTATVLPNSSLRRYLMGRVSMLPKPVSTRRD